MHAEFYAGFMPAIYTGRLVLMRDTLKVMLVGRDYRFNRLHQSPADITGEVIADGYTRGGKELTGKRLEGNTLHAAEAVWPESTIIAYGAVVYSTGGVLILHCDFGGQQESYQGKFPVSWPDGLLVV